jgi:hypothetical protein
VPPTLGPCLSFILDDTELLECFLNLPSHHKIPFALNLNQIAQGQHKDPDLWKRQMKHPLQYPEQQFGDTCVLTFKPLPPELGKFAS